MHGIDDTIVPTPEETKPQETKPQEEKPQGARPQSAKSQNAKPQEVQPKGIVKNGRVVGSNGEQIDDIEKIKNMQERQILEEELMQIFAEKEIGNEDLLHPKYLRFKENLMKRENIEEVIKVIEGKSLLDIYSEQAIHMEEGSKTRIELEQLIEELKARQEKLEASNETKDRVHEKILNDIEQRFIEFETGNEDLLLPTYNDYKQKYIKDATEDYDYSIRILNYIKETTLSGFYKDILDAMSQVEQPLDEDILAQEEIKDVIEKLKARDKHRSTSTTIVVEPKTGLIKIAIQGRENGIKFNNLLELIKQGKELQEGELISKFGINRCDPAILAALTQIGEKYPGNKELVDEYINSFNNGTDKIDEIVYNYINENENKPENYKKILKACKKYSKIGKKYGMATIEKPAREGIFKGLGSFFSNRNTKRIESKEAKEYKVSIAERFKEQRENKKDKEKPIKKRNPNAFMKKMQEKARKGKGEKVDMSEAIEKLKSINLEMGHQPDVTEKEEEEVL